MIELVIVLAALYALNVLVSWSFLTLVFDDISPKYALIPGLYIILVFLALGGGRTERRAGARLRRKPKQELDVERARHYFGPFPGP